jgi:hypothetical protein
LKEDNVTEMQKDNNMYAYLIGAFPSRTEAAEKLEYYKKYAPDAFIIKK